tara:strand:+ start:820 stop:1314 length:495 start_codon:yes stop_codon:yes gene_type:complete
MNFKPMITPKKMLRMGIFGGTYFSKQINYKDYPENWFKGLDEKYFLSKSYQSEVNFFNVRSGQTQKEWKAKGWIHEDDPRGWFEWYCKYFLGRRHEDDDRQIKRWNAFCGPKGRWRNRIYSKIHEMGGGLKYAHSISPKIQQSLLHWSYKINEVDYNKWLIYKG